MSHVSINGAVYELALPALPAPVSLSNGDVVAPSDADASAKPGSRSLHERVRATMKVHGPVVAGDEEDEQDAIELAREALKALAKRSPRPVQRFQYEFDRASDWDRDAIESLNTFGLSFANHYMFARGTPGTPAVTAANGEGWIKEVRPGTAGEIGVCPSEVPDEVVRALVVAARAGGLYPANVERARLRDERIAEKERDAKRAAEAVIARAKAKEPAVVDIESDNLIEITVAAEADDRDPTLAAFVGVPRRADGSRVLLCRRGRFSFLAIDGAKFGSPHVSVRVKGTIATTQGARNALLASATRLPPTIEVAFYRANATQRDGRAIDRSELGTNSRSLKWITTFAKDNRDVILRFFRGEVPDGPNPGILAAEFAIRSELQEPEAALEAICSGIGAPRDMKDSIERWIASRIELAIAGGDSVWLSAGVRVVPTVGESVVAGAKKIAGKVAGVFA